MFRVLKPGCHFVTYEWVATNKFDPKNPEHVRVIDEINFGNGLPVSGHIMEARVHCNVAHVLCVLQVPTSLYNSGMHFQSATASLRLVSGLSGGNLVTPRAGMTIEFVLADAGDAHCEGG